MEVNKVDVSQNDEGIGVSYTIKIIKIKNLKYFIEEE